MQNEPDKPLPMTGKVPTPTELEWARFAAKTPHYVLSSTLILRFGRARVSYGESVTWLQTPSRQGHLPHGPRCVPSAPSTGGAHAVGPSSPGQRLVPGRWTRIASGDNFAANVG